MVRAGVGEGRIGTADEGEASAGEEGNVVVDLFGEELAAVEGVIKEVIVNPKEERLEITFRMESVLEIKLSYKRKKVYRIMKNTFIVRTTSRIIRTL